MFSLYKAHASSVPSERFIASGAIADGAPVTLAAGASGAELGKVSQLAGGSAATELTYGIAMHAAVDGAEVLVIPVSALPGSVWIADAAANANVTSVNQDNYLTATTLTLVVGASTNQGKKCTIIGQLGAAADKKYLVRLNKNLV